MTTRPSAESIDAPHSIARSALRVTVAALVVAVAIAGASCGDGDDTPGIPKQWTVQVSPAAPEPVRIAASDAVDYLDRMGREATLEKTRNQGSCAPRRGLVVLAGNGLANNSLNGNDKFSKQTWRIDGSRCQGGAKIKLAGGGRFGRQYAVYEWLHQIGVRFFHPEQEFVPDRPQLTDRPIVRQHTPAFKWRSVSLHLKHPLELGDAFERGKKKYFDEAKRYIDWQLKNKASFGTSGVGSGKLSDYGLRRGFSRSTGFNLLEKQQGAESVIDPDDPRKPTVQIAEAIDKRMGGKDAENPPKFFSFSFNPSEFTEADDEKTVEYLTFVSNYFEKHYPETILLTTNHGTAGEPTDDLGVRFYDLPKFAPKNLGVKVHSLMFYDLFRPAPVYGNENFNNLYNFMVEEYRDRRIWHFPEAAWWLTFDIAVPLYLPVTIEARHRDIQGISFMLEGKLDGHRVFGTGHEWGYWQNEYCSFRMAADLSYGWRDCISDIAYATGSSAAPVVEGVLEKVVQYQERDLIYGDILRYVVGTDPETELAASVGVKFHPLPPTPSEMLDWKLDRVERWKRRIRPALKRMDRQYADLVERLENVADDVPESGTPWFREIRDGIEVTGLRARHAWQIYGALVLKRESQIRNDSELAKRADQLLKDAKKTTKRAIQVIRRREKGYRYEPLRRSIGGGPDGTKDDNWTIYDYRYLNRTHWGYYYKRIDRLATEAFKGGDRTVRIEDAVVGPGDPLKVEVVDDELSEVSVAFGDGTSKEGTSVQHTYSNPGVYEVVVSGKRSGDPFSRSVDVARVADETITGFDGKVREPSGVSIIEPVLPGLAYGPTSGDSVALGFTAAEDGDVPPNLWKPLDRVSQGGEYSTTPERMTVPVVDRSTGEVRTNLVVREGVLTRMASETRLSGKLSTSAVVDAVVSVGGFEREGARELVASTLGYTPDTLPDTVPFEIAYNAGDGGGDAGPGDAGDAGDSGSTGDTGLSDPDGDAGPPEDASDGGG